MGIVELRHMDGFKSNFGVNEMNYITFAKLQEKQLLQLVIYSNVKEFIEQNHYLFEALWNGSMPAELKIREIEEGIEPDVIEVINNPSKSKDLFLSFLESATKEILVLIPSYNQFVRKKWG